MASSTSQRSPAWAGVATLALYFSGFLVLLTPLPLVLESCRNRDLRRTAVPCIFIIFLIYRFVVPQLHLVFLEHPQLLWFFLPPGIQLFDQGGSQTVTIFGLTYFLYFVGMSYLLAHVLKQKEKAVHVLGEGTGLLILSVFLIYFLYCAAVGASPLGLAHQYIEMAFSSIPLPNNSFEEMAFFRENLPELIAYLKILSPSIVGGSILVTVMINFFLVQRLGPVFGLKLNEDWPRWRIPFALVWTTIFFLVILLAQNYFSSEILKLVGLNGALLLAVVYFFQGISIAAFFLEKWGVSPLIRVVAYTFILISLQFFGPLLLTLSFFDAWFDFRKVEASQKIGKIGG